MTAAIAVAMAVGAAGVAEAAPPTGVTAAAFHGRVDLAWQPVAGATAYRVYRGLGEGTVNVPISGDLHASATSFTDETVVTGTEVFYAVRAIVAGSETVASRVASATPPARTCTSTNVVVAENCLAGTEQWRVSNPQDIAGFATAQSVDHGESVDLKVKTGGDYNVEILRTGYYGGLGARQLGMIRDIPANTQAPCATNDPTTGLLDCANWDADQTVTTTASWPSGVYLINLVPRAAPVDTNTVLLVVRDDERHSDLLYGVPDTTYQAYNDWGGRSLYAFNSAPDPQATKVSFNRPYAQTGSTQPDWYTRSDLASVYWLELSGYDVSYAAVSDFEQHGARVRDHRAFVSGAHDEYWSDAMRQALEDARAAKTHLFFTGANALYEKVRFEGADGRVLVDYKTFETDLVDPSGPTGTWRDPFGANRPENALLGAMYIGDSFPNYFPLHVSSAEGRSRVWRHTGLDVQPPGSSTSVGSGLVGWEWDARVANGLEPAGVETVASSPVEGNLVQGNGGQYTVGNATAQMVRYVAPSGAVVVDTATNHWNRGLVPDGELFADGEADVRIRQATMNILADMRAAPGTPEPDLVYDPPPPDPEPPLDPGPPLPDPDPPAGGGTPPAGGGTLPPGGHQAAPRVRGTIHARWRRSGGVTRLVRLWATNVAKASTIDVRCARRSCGLARVALRFGRSGTVDLTRLIPRRNLRPGAVLGVRILAGGRVGKVARFTVAPKRLPRRVNLCMPPDARSPLRC